MWIMHYNMSYKSIRTHPLEVIVYCTERFWNRYIYNLIKYWEKDVFFTIFMDINS